MCSSELAAHLTGGTRPICGPPLLADAQHRLVASCHSWATSRSAIFTTFSDSHI